MSPKKISPLLLILSLTIIFISFFLILFLPSSDKNLPAGSSACFRSGCSGQLCSDQLAGESGLSTCEWKPVYACYSLAKCERQSDGRCAFTPNDEYLQCLRQKLKR